MKKILVIFGSKSDSQIYDVITKELDEKDIQYRLVVASAHRSPGVLKEVLDDGPYSLIIAGAGLAAHLPGVIASKTIRPVIGVPVASNFDGLDAFLSIIQMPPKVPVLAVGVDNAREASRNAVLATGLINQDDTDKGIKDEKILIITNSLGEERFKKAVLFLEDAGIPFRFAKNPEKEKVNIIAFDLKGDEEVPVHEDKLCILVPIKEKSSAEDSIRLMRLAESGMFVGINRADNAVIAAAQIININGADDDYHLEFRRKMEKGIKDGLTIY